MSLHVDIRAFLLHRLISPTTRIDSFLLSCQTCFTLSSIPFFTACRSLVAFSGRSFFLQKHKKDHELRNQELPIANRFFFLSFYVKRAILKRMSGRSLRFFDRSICSSFHADDSFHPASCIIQHLIPHSLFSLSFDDHQLSVASAQSEYHPRTV